jgi:hypothetical protein
MPGLVPGIHVFGTTSKEDVDGRDKPGHDEEATHSQYVRQRLRMLTAFQSGSEGRALARLEGWATGRHPSRLAEEASASGWRNSVLVMTISVPD